MNKILCEILSGKRTDRRPVWLMRQAGRYLPEYREVRKRAGTFLDLCYDPALAEEVTLQPLRRFDLDAAIVFADILLVPHALGQEVTFREGEGPVLEPVLGDDDFGRLSIDRLDDRLSPVCETVDRLSTSLPDDVALIGFCGAPWTVATYMIEGGTSRDRGTARRSAWEASRRPDHWFSRLIDLLVEASVGYLARQVEAGADVLQIFETWALDLPPTLFRRFCVEPNAEIVRRVAETCPETPIVVFPRGTGQFASVFCKAVGCAGYGCDQGADLRAFNGAEMAPYVVQGNLDPVCLLHGGDALEREVGKIVERTERGRHVFNLGHGVLPDTPPDHVDRMLAALEQAERNEDRSA